TRSVFMPERDTVSTAAMSTTTSTESTTKRGITVKRLFTKAGTHPFDEVDWELRTASIQNEKGQTIFEQRNVEVPKDWSQTATNSVKMETEAYRHPQCSACFINSVQDNLPSILTLAKTEGMLFKWGSGTGTNLSPLRSSLETLSGGGTASGPLSFMKGFDAFAGVIKSGGKTRRAAKMVILNIDHPDIVDFIECKAKE